MAGKIDTKTPAMDHLLEIYGMGNAIHVINKAMELDIFELLYLNKEPVSAKDLAAKNQFKPEILARLLNCLTALKLVKKEKKGDQVFYSNTKAGDLLSKSHPDTFKAMPNWNSMFSKFLEGLPDQIKIKESGEKKDDACGEEENWDDWPADFDLYQGFHNFLAPQAKQLVTHYDLKDYKSCVDLGGGTGVIAFELRRQYPEMAVTVFEMKNVVQLAEEKFVPGNEQLGVKFIIGDFFKTPFPNVDLFIIARVLRNMSQKEMDDLLSKCYQALNPGGAVLAFEQMQNEERDGSISATLWDLVNMGWGTGIPNPSDYREIFNRNGFKDVSFTFTQDWQEYDLILAKKEKK